MRLQIKGIKLSLSRSFLPVVRTRQVPSNPPTTSLLLPSTRLRNPLPCTFLLSRPLFLHGNGLSPAEDTRSHSKVRLVHRCENIIRTTIERILWGDRHRQNNGNSTGLCTLVSPGTQVPRISLFKQWCDTTLVETWPTPWLLETNPSRKIPVDTRTP